MELADVMDRNPLRLAGMLRDYHQPTRAARSKAPSADKRSTDKYGLLSTFFTAVIAPLISSISNKTIGLRRFISTYSIGSSFLFIIFKSHLHLKQVAL